MPIFEGSVWVYQKEVCPGSPACWPLFLQVTPSSLYPCNPCTNRKTFLLFAPMSRCRLIHHFIIFSSISLPAHSSPSII